MGVPATNFSLKDESIIGDHRGREDHNSLTGREIGEQAIVKDEGYRDGYATGGIKQDKGIICAYSMVGKGTIFTIMLRKEIGHAGY